MAAAPDSVDAVRCRVHPLVLKVAANPRPQTGLEAKFSIAYCAASALVKGEAGEAEFSDTAFRDPAVMRVMTRVITHVITRIMTLCHDAASWRAL